jgi:hypothetical protein
MWNNVFCRLNSIRFQGPLALGSDTLNRGVFKVKSVKKMTELQLSLVLLELIERPYPPGWNLI